MSTTYFPHRSFIVLVCCLACYVSNSQTANSSFRKKIFKTTVSTDMGSQYGYLYNLSDTSVLLSPNLIAFREPLLAVDGPLKSLSYANIQTITVARKGAGGRGTLLGALTGALVGLITYKKSTGSYALDFGPAANAAIGALVGAPVGLLIGSINLEKTYKIYRDKTSFVTFKESILPTVNN